MTRATLTVTPLVRPANLYASMPAVYDRRTETVGELEARLAHEAEILKTRLAFTATRLRKAARLNLYLAATALTAVAVGLGASAHLVGF